MNHRTFRTPALRDFAAGRPVQPIGYLPDGRPVYPIAGGAENVEPGPGALPSAEDLQGMTDEQVQDALDSALSESEDLAGMDPASMTDEQVARLEALADFAETVDGETARREQVAAERAERVEAARARLTPVDAGGDEGDGDEGDGEGDEAPVETPEVETPAPEAVAAGGARRTARPAPRRNPRPAAAQRTERFSLIAAADVGGQFSAGQTLESMTQVAEAFAQRSRSFPQGVARVRNVRHQHNVALIRRNHEADPDGLYIGNPDFASEQAVFQAAAREGRLKGGSLVAAGGWCAPSETLYGLTSAETLDGLIDLPTVGVNRGGINYTPGPDFSDIYATAGFSQTEAQAIAGTEKACVEVDCPDFSEVRLDAVGYCVKAPLLTRAAYPEVIQRWIEGTMVANAHKVAARLVSSMRTALGTAIAPTLVGMPVAWSTLTAIELVIEGQRQAYRLSDGETLEVKAPRWLRVALRADLANRLGIGAESVSNAQIAQHFADRGASVQFILNYQELSSPKTIAAFPSTVEVMVYPAGTFVRGNADVVSLDTVYDTADLQTNVYTAAFVEDGVLLAKMQHGGARITLPVNVTGQLGAANITARWGSTSS